VPLCDTARRIGPVDFSNLVIKKGTEIGLLIDAEFLTNDGRPRYGYEVRQPSRTTSTEPSDTVDQ
jgi:hypothetical protein